MSYERSEQVVASVELGQGITLQALEVTYTRDGEYHSKYTHNTLEGVSGNDIEALAQLAALLKNLPEEGALDLDQEGLEDFLKDWAADTAEQAELPFTYTDGFGSTQTYTPASLWEASGSCSEWEESAQEGYDYGWNI
ncbi:hypothetical protein REC_160 [Pseudomonas phage REC]|nr:hypothetical protein REC_160 [Pseudomonas phage REC]UGL62564.1 hypothetical protein [Pseudomonas phage REC1]